MLAGEAESIFSFFSQDDNELIGLAQCEHWIQRNDIVNICFDAKVTELRNISEMDRSMWKYFSLSELERDKLGRKLVNYPDASWLSTIFALGRRIMQKKGLGERLSSEDRYLCCSAAIGESLASHFPESFRFKGKEAETYFAEVITHLVSTDIQEAQQVFIEFNNDLWYSESKYFFKYRYGLDKTLRLPVHETEILTPLSPWWKILKDPEMCREVLCLFARAMTEKCPTHSLWLTSHALAAFSKNIHIFLPKLVNGLKNDFNIEIPYNIQFCELIFLAYKDYLNPELLDTLIEKWNNLIPSSALYLKLIAKQIKNNIFPEYKLKDKNKGCSF